MSSEPLTLDFSTVADAPPGGPPFAETAPPTTQAAPKRGRPAKAGSDAEKKRERDRRYRERQRMKTGGPNTEPPPNPSAPPTDAKPQGSTMQSELDALNNAYQEAPPVNGAPGQAPGAPGAQPLAATLVSGYVLVLVTDALFPALIAWGLRKFAKRDDVTADALRLSQREKDALEPIADRAASFILGRIDPVTLYLSVAGAMYITRIPPNPNAKQPKKVSKADKERTNTSA